MAVYEYRGFTGAGEDVKGIIDADSPKAARSKLRRSGIYPVEVVTEGGSAPAVGVKRGREKISLPEVSVLTRQMGTLLTAGLPLCDALTALQEQTEREQTKKVIAGVRESVAEGSSLSTALSGYPRVFSDLYIHMVQAGESSGTLDRMLFRVADFLENQVRLRNKILATITYPLFMLAVSFIVLLFLIAYVIPQVTQVFEDLHSALPLPTVVLIGISESVRRYWWLLLGIGAAGFFFIRRYLATPVGRERCDRLVLGIPLLGRVTKMIALSRFTRTLATLLASGVPLLVSLDIVMNIVHNTALKKAIGEARENIKEGESIAEPLRRSGIFPPLVTHMIAVGERSGELEGMLTRVAEVYDNEVETVVESLTSLLGPVMILMMGGVVFFIVLSVLLPLFEMSQAIR